MGNFPLSRKDFQSVVPEDGSTQPSNKKNRSPNSKKAPTPDGEKFVCTNNFPIIDKLPSLIRNDLSFQSPSVTLPQCESFDFKQTESQLRRKGMADCEFECSQITSYLFVGGCHVASNWELLKSNDITRVVNCSSAVVDNYFINDPSMTYLSINMHDGRQDDVFWFVSEVIQFIIKARSLGEKVLIHCEKGVSRSCSFAIVYRMWSAGDKWKTAFEYVKLRRAVCAPNTAFTCNLIEIGEIFTNEVVTRNMLFRVAFHLPHDPLTAVLKLCRNSETRKIILPATSLLDPQGVFVVRTTNHDTNNQFLFLWQGAQASSTAVEKARMLSSSLFGIVTNAQVLLEVQDTNEGELFLSSVINDGVFGEGDNSSSSVVYDDLYDKKPSMEAALAFQKEHDQMRINRDRPQAMRESSIQGFETYPEMDSIREQLSNKELSFRDMDLGCINYPGKVLKNPSLRIGSDSRRNSHSKVAAIISSTDLSGKHSPPDGMKLSSTMPHNGYIKYENINIDNLKNGEERKVVVKLDLSGVKTTVPLALHLGSLAQLDESPVPNSQRDSSGCDDSPSLPSNKTASVKQTLQVEVEQLMFESPESTRRSLIDKITDAIDCSPRNEQQSCSQKTDNCVTSFHSKISTLVPANQATEKFRGDSLKSDKDDSTIRPAEMSNGGLSSAGSMSRIPVLVGREAQSKSALEKEEEEKVLLRSPSKLRMLSFLVGGSESRSTVDGPSIFRNNSRIVPLPGGDNSERKLSTITDSTQTMSRLSSPSSIMTREDSKRRLSLSLSPSAVHCVSNVIATPIQELLMPTSFTDRRSDHVNLSRKPTPTEDSGRRNSSRGGVDSLVAENKTSAALYKPTLYQVTTSQNRKFGSNQNVPLVLEWQAMGVYDDEDLSEGCILLLLCPKLPHFLWIGTLFDFAATGVDSESDDSKLLMWVGGILSGEVQFKRTVGKYLTSKTLSINRSGDESDAFWVAFNEGY